MSSYASGGGDAAGFLAFGLSDRGKVRPRNEDRFVCQPDRALLAVADGMGGAPGGERASETALEAFSTHPSISALESASATEARQGLTSALEEAYIRVAALSRADPGLRGLGTTFTAVLILPERREYALAHVGDSRAYLLSSRSASPSAPELVRLTQDHTRAQEAVDAGVLAPEEAEGHPLSHVLTRVVGDYGPLEPQVQSGSLGAGWRLILCSDGLTGCVADREIEELLRAWPDEDPEGACRELVGLSLSRGAPDNVTVVVAFQTVGGAKG